MEPELIAAAAAVAAAAAAAAVAASQRRGLSRLAARLDAAAPGERIERDLAGVQAGLERTRDDLSRLRESFPHTAEVEAVQQNVGRLCGDFEALRADLSDRVSKITLAASESLDASRRHMVGSAREEILGMAREQMASGAVGRDEFEALRGRVERSLGPEEVEGRAAALASIFDSAQIRTLNWQCRVVGLLRGGLAPDAEEDVIASNGIPRSALRGFLRRLEEAGVATQRSVRAWYLSPESEWLQGYVANPDWLRARLEAGSRRERDYQAHVAASPHLVEAGLRVESAEYDLPTGRIDLMCVDSTGRNVGVELKYPAASVRDFRQVAGYRRDYAEKTGRRDARFVLAAPSVPPELREMLEADGMEWREIPF